MTYVNGRYHAPLSVDLSVQERKTIYRGQRVKLAQSNAARCARTYATVLIKRSEASGFRPMEIAGGLNGIERTMARYAVHVPLRAYAAREVERILREGNHT